MGEDVLRPYGIREALSPLADERNDNPVCVEQTGLCDRPDAVCVVQRAVAERRPVYVCGGDRLARGLAKSLRQQGVIVTAFIDRAPHALGATLDGLPIQPVASLEPNDPRRPFMTVVGSSAADLDADLASAGWVRDQDYVIL